LSCAAHLSGSWASQGHRLAGCSGSEDAVDAIGRTRPVEIGQILSKSRLHVRRTGRLGRRTTRTTGSSARTSCAPSRALARTTRSRCSGASCRTTPTV